MSLEEGPESQMRKKIKAPANTFISALQDPEEDPANPARPVETMRC